MSTWAVVVAAGSGARFGGPKQYEVLGDRRVLDWSLEAAATVADGVVLAVAASDADRPEPGADAVAVGGRTRSESVRAALALVPADAEIVVVHDAARPLASPALFRSVIDALATGASAAIPVTPVTDTVKRIHHGCVVATLDRSELVAVQTPQAFVANALRNAHAGGSDATDDAALVEAQGGLVVVVPGEPSNTKVTTREDLEVARLAMGRRQAASS